MDKKNMPRPYRTVPRPFGVGNHDRPKGSVCFVKSLFWRRSGDVVQELAKNKKKLIHLEDGYRQWLPQAKHASGTFYVRRKYRVLIGHRFYLRKQTYPLKTLDKAHSDTDAYDAQYITFRNREDARDIMRLHDIMKLGKRRTLTLMSQKLPVAEDKNDEYVNRLEKVTTEIQARRSLFGRGDFRTISKRYNCTVEDFYEVWRTLEEKIQDLENELGDCRDKVYGGDTRVVCQFYSIPDIYAVLPDNDYDPDFLKSKTEVVLTEKSDIIVNFVKRTTRIIQTVAMNLKFPEPPKPTCSDSKHSILYAGDSKTTDKKVTTVLMPTIWIPEDSEAAAELVRKDYYEGDKNEIFPGCPKTFDREDIERIADSDDEDRKGKPYTEMVKRQQEKVGTLLMINQTLRERLIIDERKHRVGDADLEGISRPKEKEDSPQEKDEIVTWNNPIEIWMNPPPMVTSIGLYTPSTKLFQEEVALNMPHRKNTRLRERIASLAKRFGATRKTRTARLNAIYRKSWMEVYVYRNVPRKGKKAFKAVTWPSRPSRDQKKSTSFGDSKCPDLQLATASKHDNNQTPQETSHPTNENEIASPTELLRGDSELDATTITNPILISQTVGLSKGFQEPSGILSIPVIDNVILSESNQEILENIFTLPGKNNKPKTEEVLIGTHGMLKLFRRCEEYNKAILSEEVVEKQPYDWVSETIKLLTHGQAVPMRGCRKAKESVIVPHEVNSTTQVKDILKPIIVKRATTRALKQGSRRNMPGKFDRATKVFETRKSTIVTSGTIQPPTQIKETDKLPAKPLKNLDQCIKPPNKIPYNVKSTTKNKDIKNSFVLTSSTTPGKCEASSKLPEKQVAKEKYPAKAEWASTLISLYQDTKMSQKDLCNVKWITEIEEKEGQFKVARTTQVYAKSEASGKLPAKQVANEKPKWGSNLQINLDRSTKKVPVPSDVKSTAKIEVVAKRTTQAPEKYEASDILPANEVAKEKQPDKPKSSESQIDLDVDKTEVPSNVKSTAYDVRKNPFIVTKRITQEPMEIERISQLATKQTTPSGSLDKKEKSP